MMQFTTIYTSNIPVECYIVKGRLESEGIKCYVYDENIVSINPFRAIAVGGVKLKVHSDDAETAIKIIELSGNGRLIDENGEYNISEIFENEIKRQNEIIEIKHFIQTNPSTTRNPQDFKSIWLNNQELNQLIADEVRFYEISCRKFKFDCKQFIFDFFDFDRSVFTYFRNKPIDYYIDKEIVDNYFSQKKDKSNCANCPKCNSDDVYFSYAIDYKIDIWYLLLSFLLFIPFPPLRKKFHCFNCGYNFRKYLGKN